MYKSRGTTILICLLLGGIGGHKFYLEKPGIGILYLLFCWTFIPLVISIFELIGYLLTSDQKFQQQYGGGVPQMAVPQMAAPGMQQQKPKTSPLTIIIGLAFIGIIASVVVPDKTEYKKTVVRPAKTATIHSTESFMCKAATAEHMGRKVKTMSSVKSGSKYHITYPRPDNGKTAGVYCWREGKRLLWQTDGMDYTYKGTSNFTGKPGRIRNTQHDEVITFTTKPMRLTIKIKYSDGSGHSTVYKIPKSEQVSI